ncbi:tubby C-terminal-like domain-containing protein [Kockovaella imperatae]|uniref:Tubby C-terminal-like domain-containing protein n=1 Tax=Kockovaella imperatae TaxID=4999 RepID=A0A1Y1UBM1_9TREE|nr:tubby C-terminal-like domain-containing protein [Kockovaella imperatae]ORX35443.1 tubby C-terminal-like domain-containing protein [Kockovaella imperatae]
MALAPVNPPLGVFQHYYAGRPTTLVLKEKIMSWTGDDFSVKDTDGNVVCRCSGQAFSLRERKIITDPNGNELFHLRKKQLAIHSTWIGEDAGGSEIFAITKHFSLGTKMRAKFTNVSTGARETISIRGGILSQSADITIGEDGSGPAVARIERKLFSLGEWAGQQTYTVTVAQGVDLALIAAICICFDEAKHEASAAAA